MNNLYRSRRDRKITGLCGGLGEAFNFDPTLLRLLLVVITVFSGGTVFVIYLIASMVIPKEPTYYDPTMHGGFHGGPGGYHGDYAAGPDHHGGPGRFGGQRGYGGGMNTGDSSYEPKAKAKNDDLDDMMSDLEKKAMKKEIEQLRNKLNKYEKGDE